MHPERPNLRPPSLALERIVLIGFMGAGKSTVGPVLARRLDWQFVDADHELESQAQSTIAEIFRTLGEPAFRHMEETLAGQLLERRLAVVSLGGGAVESGSTRALLADSPGTCVVFLKAPVDVLIQRCEQQRNAAERPVLNQRELLVERFLSRLPHYQGAHLTVDTDGLEPEKVTDRILEGMLQASYAVPLHGKAMTH